MTISIVIIINHKSLTGTMVTLSTHLLASGSRLLSNVRFRIRSINTARVRMARFAGTRADFLADAGAMEDSILENLVTVIMTLDIQLSYSAHNQIVKGNFNTSRTSQFTSWALRPPRCKTIIASRGNQL